MHPPTNQNENVSIPCYIGKVLLMIEQCSEKQVALWVDSKVNISSSHFEKECYFINTVVVSIHKYKIFRLLFCFSNDAEFIAQIKIEFISRENIDKEKTKANMNPLNWKYIVSNWEIDNKKYIIYIRLQFEYALNAINLFLKWNFLKFSVKQKKLFSKIPVKWSQFFNLRSLFTCN